MRKLGLAIALLSIAVLPACKKKQQDATPVVNNISEIKVPAGFNWESSHNVAFKAEITDARFGGALHVISVYDGNPYEGGNIIAKGTASTAAAYTNQLYLSNQLTEVYVVKTSPDNSSIVSKVNVSGATADVSFGATDPTVHRPAQKSAAKITSDCSSGCTTTITTTTTNVTVNSGNVICITGSNISVSFASINGGTIRVCGTNVTLSNVNLDAPAALIITTGGSANMSSMNFNNSSASVTVDGTLNYSGSFPDNGVVTINGSMNCGGDFNLNSSAGVFTNNGTLNISGTFNKGNSATATNNASMTVSGNFQPNTGLFVNNCSLTVSGNYNQSAAVQNYNFIKVVGTTTINSSVELGLYNGAMFKTNGFINNALVKGYGSTSLLKITASSVTINSGAFINSAVQVCTPASVDASKLTGGAALGCGLYIAVTGCNTEGNGTASVTDSDGDGVADGVDEYPADATKAYNSYYPSSTGAATVAFEDQWPLKGDFDLNDLVMSYRYQIVTNASNVVVQAIGNYTMSATGGALGNGFGVQFPVNKVNVSNVTGGTLENGQTKAVILLFNNMRDEMANWNTVTGATTSAARTYTVSFNVSSGPSISTFGLSGYNPFIWNHGLGDDRGREIHVSGRLPTDLANTGYFGTHDDSTVVAANRYYLTKGGLPYAIEIPTSPFSYPKESVDITQAYLRFSAWATSSGSTFADWYSNTASGYRNTANIY